MPICKHCTQSFHHCTSCGYDEYADRGFCSQICYELSGTGKTVYDLIKLVVDGIPDELYQPFCTLMLDDDNEGSGGMDSIPDGEWFFNEYALRRKLGNKVFCKMKLDEALATIEREKQRKLRELERGALWAAQAAESELQTFKRLLSKYGTKEELEDNR
jgi:hypothetical protein